MIEIKDITNISDFYVKKKKVMFSTASLKLSPKIMVIMEKDFQIK